MLNIAVRSIIVKPITTTNSLIGKRAFHEYIIPDRCWVPTIIAAGSAEPAGQKANRL